MIEHNGLHYSTVRGSDVDRDGMYLELHLGDSDGFLPLIEVFYSDIDGSFTLSTFAEATVPLAVVDQFLAEARLRLPPLRQQRETMPAADAGRDAII